MKTPRPVLGYPYLDDRCIKTSASTDFCVCFVLLVVRLSVLISLLSRLMLQLFKCQIPALTEACFDRELRLKGALSPSAKFLLKGICRVISFLSVVLVNGWF